MLSGETVIVASVRSFLVFIMTGGADIYGGPPPKKKFQAPRSMFQAYLGVKRSGNSWKMVFSEVKSACAGAQARGNAALLLRTARLGFRATAGWIAGFAGFGFLGRGDKCGGSNQ